MQETNAGSRNNKAPPCGEALRFDTRVSSWVIHPTIAKASGKPGDVALSTTYTISRALCKQEVYNINSRGWNAGIREMVGERDALAPVFVSSRTLETRVGFEPTRDITLCCGFQSRPVNHPGPASIRKVSATERCVHHVGQNLVAPPTTPKQKSSVFKLRHYLNFGR